MGTVIGAVIVFSVLSQNEELSKLLLLPSSNEKLDYYHFILLGLYGLTYCYIASAPILVWHATRFTLVSGKNEKNFRSGWVATFFITVCVVVLSIFCSGINIVWLAVILFFLIFGVQAFLIWSAGSNMDNNYIFYKKLAEKRRRDKTDLRESYKHLREHGNSFGIIFFEIIMGVSLAVVEQEHADYLLSFILLWSLPAVFVWFIGTGLESKFLND